MRTTWAICVATLRSAFSRPTDVLFTAGLMLGLGGAAYLPLHRWLLPTPEPDSATTEEQLGAPCDALPPVTLAGALPPWLSWPGELAPPDESAALVRFAARQAEILALAEDTDGAAIIRCLLARADAERDHRLAELGIWRWPVRADTTDAARIPPARLISMETQEVPRKHWVPSWPQAPGGALLLAPLLAVFAVVPYSLPVWRGDGFMETLGSLPTRRRGLALGVLLATWIAAMVYGLLAWFGWCGAGLSQGGTRGIFPLWALPSFALGLAALGTAFVAGARDGRSALFRIVPFQLTVMLLLWAAFAAESWRVGWGAWVPLGGLMMSALGWSDARLIPTISAVGLAGIVCGWALTRFERADMVLSAGDPVLARRARGDYRPEALLLACISTGGSLVLIGSGEGLLANLIATQIGFMVLPALVAPTILGLNRARMLGLSAPRSRAVLTAPLMALGTLSAATGVMAIQDQLWSPPTRWLELFSNLFEPLMSGPGLVVITVGAAVAEEILFRGAILGLLRRNMKPLTAVLLQALVFALIHGMAIRLAPTFFIGTVLGLLAVRTRSIWPGVLVHALHNLGAVLLSRGEWTPDLTTLVLGGLVGVLAFGLGTRRSAAQ